VKARYWVPLAVFVALLAVLWVGLRLDPREVPSPLIGKPAPAFSLPRLDKPEVIVAKQDMLGKVWLLNVWASWCVSCREEHALLVDFARDGVAPLIGLNHKDERKDGLRWLAQFGNPYTISIFDHDGRVGIDYGVYGVPETFVIDKQGVIRYKRIGVLTPEIVRDKIVPLVKELNASA
jgi:cytochrome c biogenesis protein CcmG/thiol:disulfide interchange protein DsbE